MFPSHDRAGVYSDTSDGYFKSAENNNSVKLPHNNFTVLGIVDECINSPYAEEFSKEVVEFFPYTEEGCGGYVNYMSGENWCDDFEKAIDSMKMLMVKLDLKPTDYILRDESKM